MDFFEIMRSFLTFFQDNLLITIVFACVLLFVLYWKTRLFLLILFITLLLIGILYIISDVTSTGLSKKKKLIQEEGISLRIKPIYLGIKCKSGMTIHKQK